MLLHLLALVLFLTISSFCYEVEKDLVTVLLIYRHGDRTPINTYPNDPYKNVSFWPTDFGQLTNVGKMEHFMLGQWLRKRYSNFLPLEYSEKDVYIRSSAVDRALMSAEVNLAGLFPPTGNQIWNARLTWQPIPIHSTPDVWDNTLAMKHPCDKFTHLLEELLSSPEFKNIQQENQQLYEYLSKNTGSNITTIEKLLYLYDTLFIENLYNFTLPDWTKNVFPEKLSPWAKFAFAVDCYTPDLARLKAGPLMNDIVNHFSQSVNNTGYKFIMYSAHDTTIANALNSLQLFEYHCPPYGATIFFELRYINGSHFVNILYKNSSIPTELKLKDCDFYCPLDKFTKILQPLLITPEQWKIECELESILSNFVLQSALLIVGLALLTVLSILLVLRIVTMIKGNGEYEYVQIPNHENAIG